MDSASDTIGKIVVGVIILMIGACIGGKIAVIKCEQDAIIAGVATYVVSSSNPVPTFVYLSPSNILTNTK